MKNIFKNRRFKYGSFATIFSIVFIVAIVIINTIFTVLADHFPLSLDLTQDSIFELSADTRDYIGNLEQDVEIILFSPEEDFVSNSNTNFIQAAKVINKYQMYSDRIKVTYVDTVKNPTYTTTNFPDLELTPSSIVVKSGDRIRQMIVNDLFNIETDSYGNSYIISSKAEQAMTSAILGVTSDDLVKVSVLQGLGEVDMSDFTDLLEQNNYEIVEQNILTEEIDPEAEIVILYAPTMDLGESILKKLDDFLINGDNYGKTLLYFASDEQDEMPNLAAFLAEWGIEVSPGVIYDSNASNVISNYFLPIVTNVDEDYALPTDSSRQSYTVFPYSRPLTALFEDSNGFKVSSLLEFSSTSGIFPQGVDMSEAQSFIENKDNISGPHSAILKSTKTRYTSDAERLSSNVIVSSSLMSINSSLLSNPSLRNSEYYLNMLNVITERGDTIYIEAKTVGGATLNITFQQVLTLGVVFAVALPLIVLICGVVVWLRRRNK